MRPTERSALRLGRGPRSRWEKWEFGALEERAVCEWRSRGGRNPSWGRESAAFGEDIRNEEEERGIGRESEPAGEDAGC